MPTTRADGWRSSWSGAAWSAVALWICGGCGGSKPPNVVLISIDMLRPDHLQCYGYGQPTSPNIDALAREGVAFDRNFASSSWTLPSHAAIFTSLPDSLHGCWNTERSLDPSATTLAERFQAAGYETAGFFSGPYLHPAFGLGQGFERYEDCTSYADRMDGRPREEWAMDKDVMIASHKDVTNERTYGAVKGWMDHRSKKPFFLFVHLWDVHFDFIPPPPYDKKFDPAYQGWVDGQNFFFDDRYSPSMGSRDFQHLLALYDGEIAWTDSIVGRIRADLEKQGLLDDTVIALTSDHGTEFFEHGEKGHRKTLYDEVLRTPLVLRYPKSLPANRRVPELSRGIDLGPTLLDLAGLPLTQDVLGQSLLPLIKNPGTHGVGRAVSELNSVGHHQRCVRTLKWKLVDQIALGEHWYFDLQRDPWEQSPLTDFDSELGKKAVAGYEAEVEVLNTFSERHEVPAARGAAAPEVPEHVREQLKELGYAGDEKQPPGAGAPRADAPPKEPGTPPAEPPK